MTMAGEAAEPQVIEAAGPTDSDAILHLKTSVEQGTHWFVALLEAIALWHSSEETHRERHYRYLVGGEAFDWLLLAERLLDEIEDAVPEQEKEALLFFNQFPVEVTPWEFQRLLGRTKYRAYLNFWYGVLVEEALLLAVEERIAKDRQSIGLGARVRDHQAVYLRVYDAPLTQLLTEFFAERGLPFTDELALSEYQEFTYWCFKYRLNRQDPAKVASDTRLGLHQLQGMRSRDGHWLRSPFEHPGLF
ncbi:MAG: hypothetical protein EXR51_09415 [Dehalococcoidia bacterium]|nr:hypothetical protein [Dehalococcoidia bacterium]